MRKLKNIAAFCALLIATVFLSACGSDEPSIVGRWDWTGDGVNALGEGFEIFADGTAVNERMSLFEGFSNVVHMAWETKGDGITFTYRHVTQYSYNIQRSVLSMRGPGAFVDSLRTRRSGDEGIVGLWQGFSYAPGSTTLRNTRWNDYLEFFADGTGREHRNHMGQRWWWEYFAWETADGTLTRTYTPTAEFGIEIEGDTLRLVGANGIYRSFTRGQTTPENMRTHPTPLPITAAESPQATPTPTPATPSPNDPLTTPTPPPSDEEFGYTGELFIPIGRWQFEHLVKDFTGQTQEWADNYISRIREFELRLYDAGVGFVRAVGISGFTHFFSWFVDDGQVIISFFDGSFGWQTETLALNEATGELWLSANHMGHYTESGVFFVPHYRQPNVSHNDERIVGEWAYAEYIQVEFLPGGMGIWWDTDYGTQQFEWLYDDDVLLVWGLGVDTPRSIIASNPIANGTLNLPRDLTLSRP